MRDLLSLQMVKFYCKSYDLLGRELQHPRPLGRNCRLHSSASLGEVVQETSQGSAAEQPGAVGGDPAMSPVAVTAKSGNNALVLILEKIQALEENNSRSHSLSGVSHSSPKKSHQLSQLCRVKVQPEGNQSESEDSLLPGAKFLKENELIQSQVQGQIRRLCGKPRAIGTVNFKSGLLRANENKKKIEVAWPHEFCYFGISGKNPQYEELSVFQIIFGHIRCIQEEQSQAVRDNMLEYLNLLMEDTIETNWATGIRAHSVVLQTMERGRCSWDKFESVDRIRMRCTQRTLQPSDKAHSDQKKCCRTVPIWSVVSNWAGLTRVNQTKQMS